MNSPLPSKKEIDGLIQYLPRLCKDGFSPIKSWGGGEKNKEGIMTLPWPEYEDDVKSFMDDASTDRWCDYQYDPSEASKMLEDQNKIESSTLGEIKTMLTFCIRGERFCDGHMGAMIETGKIKSILTRLEAISKQIRICEKHTLSKDSNVVIEEPYIPYIPEGWNGVLVLAEAQNLSKTNHEYVTYLNHLNSTERFYRLGDRDPDNLGIQPWDDGSLKLAVQSAFGIKANKTAVSNSVVWSQISPKGNNVNPSKQLINLASSFWADIFPTITPDVIVTSGKIASDVITAVGPKSWQHVRLRLPSPSAMSRVSGMFPEKELLLRYPEVRTELNENPEWANGGYRQNKIFFACHAVAIVKEENA